MQINALGLVILCVLLLLDGDVSAEMSEIEAQRIAEECFHQGCAKSEKILGYTEKLVSTTLLVDSRRSNLDVGSLNIDDELNSLKAEISENEIKITLQNGVLFDFDEYSLRDDAVVVLEKIVSILNSEQLEEQAVRVEGHTDWIGTKAYNQQLSVQRAKSVVDWLVDSGVNSKRFSSSGFGESMPLDTNETDEGRQKNRRVEIIVRR